MQTQATFKLDGEKSRWPDRLNGLEVPYPTFPEEATADELVANLLESFIDGDERPQALRDKLETARKNWFLNDLSGWLSETPEGQKEQRSATVKPEEVLEWARRWKAQPNQRKHGTSDAAKRRQAEARAKAAEGQAAKASEAIVTLLKGMPEKQQQAQIKALVADGTLPEGFTL
jgi:hypothetical protein